MSEEYSDIPDSIRSKIVGVPAFDWKDLIPKGYINQYDSISDPTGNNIPINEYSWTISGLFNYASVNGINYSTNRYQFKVSTAIEDLNTAVEDLITGKREKIYYVYIDYSYYGRYRIEDGVVGNQEGVFEIPDTYNIATFKIHIYNEERFIPTTNTEFDIYVVAGQDAIFEFNPYYTGIVREDILDSIINVFPEEPRFSASVIKLLPSIAARFAHWYQGGVPLFTASDPGAVFDAIGLASGTLGAGAALTFGLAFGVFARLFSPVFYDPFYIKMAYSVAGESFTYINEELEIDRAYFVNNALKGNNLGGSVAYLLNLKLGSDEEVINSLFYISNVVPFPYSETQKRNIGKGLLLESAPPGTSPISQDEYFNPPTTHPLRFAIIKDKKITRTYTRQVDIGADTAIRGLANRGSVYTNMPDYLIPGGRSNVQVWLDDPTGNLIEDVFSNNRKMKFYVTYQKSSKHQLRQVVSSKVFTFSTTRLVTTLNYKSYPHNTYYAYDNFYVKEKIKYNIYSELTEDQINSARSSGSIPLSPLVQTVDDPPFFSNTRSSFAEPLGWPSLFDRDEKYTNFRPNIKDIYDLLNGNSSNLTYSKASCYRMSQRKFQQGSLDIFLAEGFFVCAARIQLIGGEIVEGGIGYVDGLGQFKRLISGDQIKDQSWWFNNFKSKNTIFSIFEFTEGTGIKRVQYNRSIYANSLLTDYEKIGYEDKLANALKEITPASNGGAGIGICLLDFIDTKRDVGSIRSEVPGAALYDYEASENSSLVYVDLSEAFFIDTIAPNVRPYIQSVGAPIVDINGNITSDGTIVGYHICDDVSPIDLSRSGRFFLEPTAGVTFSSFGVRASDYMWIQSNPYDVKLGFASDYYKNIALYAKYDSERGNVRIFPLDTAAFLSYNIIENVKINRDQIETSIEQYRFNALKWYGLPLDRLPFYQHGIDAIENENDKYEISNNPDMFVNYRTVKGTYVYSSVSSLPSINRNAIKGATLNYYGEATIQVGPSIRVSRVVIECYMDQSRIADLKTETAKDPMVLGFSATFGDRTSNNENSRLNSDAVVFSAFSFISNIGLKANFNVPNYRGDINMSGPIIEWLNSHGFNFNVNLIVYENDNFENFIFNAEDVCPAIDGFTKGYVGCLSNKDDTQSVDIYATGDHDRRWRLFRNVFQSFLDDNIYGLVLKANTKGKQLYMMFALNGVLLFKTVEGYAVANLRYHGQNVVSKNNFLLGTSGDLDIHGLSSEVYNTLQNLSNEKKYEFDHLARLQPAYVVQALWANNKMLEQEYHNTLACSQINDLILSRSNSTGENLSSISFKGLNNIQYRMRLSDDIFTYKNFRAYPRISVSNYITTENENLYWPVSQPYTFEILANGSIIAFVLKDGFIHIFNSGDGRSWSLPFDFYGHRPIKWSIFDQDSAIFTNTKSFVAGSCPPIENISSCYDSSKNVLTLFYVINSNIFAQHFYDSQVSSRGSNGMSNFLNTLDPNPRSRQLSKNRPFYVVGTMSDEMVAAGKKGDNYFGIGIDRALNNTGSMSMNIEKNIFEQGFGESTLSTSCSNKAPGATYIGPGIIRLYYEDGDGVLRGATINGTSVKLDVNRK